MIMVTDLAKDDEKIKGVRGAALGYLNANNAPFRADLVRIVNENGEKLDEMETLN
ncbi:hypothetical protein [Aeribacillus alveayuensis]|uniref:Uncharacterized protein n=1 Tax=Aeribacillus alveayuensis TaxID=279215 RepID=A0ABT9VSX0_9BACI|nr:hypothetical protein [Bacillus alveayuensis]